MYVSPTTSTVPPTAAVPTRTIAPDPPQTSSEQRDDSMHEARLAATVALIKKLTGRDVKLVPPSPYLVSGPVQAQVAPVEITVPEPPKPPPSDDPDRPVTVDITEVVKRGTSARMRLTNGEPGTFLLQPELDVTI